MSVLAAPSETRGLFRSLGSAALRVTYAVGSATHGTQARTSIPAPYLYEWRDR